MSRLHYDGARFVRATCECCGAEWRGGTRTGDATHRAAKQHAAKHGHYTQVFEKRIVVFDYRPLPEEGE